MKNNMVYKMAAPAGLQESKMKEIEKIIQEHSLAAASSAAAMSLLPGVGSALVGIVGRGFTWTMLFRICTAMNINVNKDTLKPFAYAITAKVATYLAALLAGGVVISMIPGIGPLSASALSMMLNYCMVYASGVLFLGMMARASSAAGEAMTAEDLVQQINHEDLTREEIARAAKEAVHAYNESKKVNADPAAAAV